MKTQLILLENPIIVCDDLEGAKYVYEKQPRGCFVRGVSNEPFRNIDFFKQENAIHNSGHQKILTTFPGLPSIDWNGLESVLGYIDIHKLVEDLYPSTLGVPIDYFSNRIRGEHLALAKESIKEYKRLNDTAFTLQDIEVAFNAGMKFGLYKGGQSYDMNDNVDWEDYSKSLTQPKVFDIEIEMEYKDGFNYWYDYTPLIAKSIKIPFALRPKVTNDKIKIRKKL